jgi:NADPH-dependent 2,4-dienoyl-CoA reductase/sulfur reductase-like enzyme/rhodanese-related sulfurtransferase
MSKTIVIIGGVAGGASCAARLRRQDEWATIIMLEKGPFVSFANCGLPYYIGNTIKKEEDLFLADVRLFKERYNIDARVLEEAISINRDKQTVTVRKAITGEEYEQSYDELVLSPGATPLKPPFPGVDLPGIFTIRNVPDSNQVKSWIETQHVDRAVIIGGGFIGLEMAENLSHREIKVSIIERDEQIMPVIDAEMTAPLVEEMEKNGVTLLLGDSVSGFEQSEQGLLVHTAAGRKLHTDMVILAIGVKPDSRLAAEAGLEVTETGHIVVDDKLRTSAAHIYAVGDAIQVTNVISGKRTALPLAGPANRQGRIVADVISGMDRSFRGVQGTAVCGLFEVTLAATGLTEKELSASDVAWSAIYAHPGSHVGYYPGATTISMKLLFDRKDGRVLGAQAVGRNGVERRIDVIAMAMQKGASVFDLEEAELCYAPQYGAAKDPVNILGMIGSNVMRGDLKVTPWNEIGKNDAVILDVRSYGEIATSPIANQKSVTHIPLNELRSRLAELPKGQPIQVSCAVGARANNAVRILDHHGFDASLLPGGTLTLSCLNYCTDNSCIVPASTIDKPTDALWELHETVSPVSQLPLSLLHEMKAHGILREYALEQGESVTLKASSISDIMLLARGEVDVIELDQVCRHLSSAEKRRRPIRLSGNLSKSFYARSPSTLIRVDQEYLDFYDSWFAMLENLAQERPDLEDVLSHLRRPSVFINMPLTNVQEAIKRMQKIEAHAGDKIVTQGEMADNFYILVDGEAEVWQLGLDDDEPHLVAMLRAGDHFGEDALIMEGARNATVKLSRDSTLLALNGASFKELISAPLVQEVDHSIAKIQLDQGKKELLDVRYAEEWDESRIPGSILIPLPDLRKRLKELKKDKEYIIYCHSGKRSAVAAMILKQNGFEAAWLTNGIRDWPYAVQLGT